MIMLSSRTVKVRKSRRCEGCQRIWPVGAPMFTWSYVDDGEPPRRAYLCLPCDSYFDSQRFRDYDGYLPEEPVQELDPEGYREVEKPYILLLIEHGFTQWAAVREE